MKEFTVLKNDAGARLDRFVKKNAPLLPDSLLHKYLRIGRVKVSGKKQTRDYRVALGDVVSMYINDEFFDAPSEKNAFLAVSDPKLDIVYEDDNIMLVNKPSGVLCHSDGSFDYATLIARIQAYLYAKREWNPKEENSFAPALCNRIDRNTQGIVIAAKNAETLRIINEKIRIREIDKRYLAVTVGVPPERERTLTHWLFKDAKKNQVYASDKQTPGSSLAVTRYCVLGTVPGRDKFPPLALLECGLVTGRTHQIRAQLAAIGYPILGDGKYGVERINRLFRESGQLLCSYMLTFDFETDAGALNYLKGKSFKIEAEFGKRYLP